MSQRAINFQQLSASNVKTLRSLCVRIIESRMSHHRHRTRSAFDVAWRLVHPHLPAQPASRPLCACHGSHKRRNIELWQSAEQHSTGTGPLPRIGLCGGKNHHGLAVHIAALGRDRRDQRWNAHVAPFGALHAHENDRRAAARVVVNVMLLRGWRKTRVPIACMSSCS